MVHVLYFGDRVVFHVIYLCWGNPIIITKAACSVPEVNVEPHTEQYHRRLTLEIRLTSDQTHVNLEVGALINPRD